MITDLKDIYVFDDFDEKYTKCDVTFDRNEYKYRCEEGFRIATLPESAYFMVKAEKSQYTYRVDLIDERNTINASFMVMDEYQVDKIKEHINSLNTIVNEVRTAYHGVIEDIYNDICNNENKFNDLYELYQNYLGKTDYNFLLSFNHLLVFERYLLFKNRKGINTTWISSGNLFHHTTFGAVNENFSGVNIPDISGYYDNYFLKLVEITERKVDFSNDRTVSLYFTWKFLRTVAINFFGSLFEKDYGENFHNVQDINSFVNQYVRIDTLDSQSVYNASLFTYYLISKGVLGDTTNFLECYDNMANVILEAIDRKKTDDFETYLGKPVQKEQYGISDVDMMTGTEFEHFISLLFKQLGYSTTVTKGSGDQGIDVIVEKNGRKIGVQAKCYSNTVGNKAVQEVVAGLSYYGLEKGIVVTNNFFTDSAIELAEKNNVVLWNRNILKEKINEIF